MMAEIKRGFKLVRYGHGCKLNVFGGVLFWVLGILMFCFSNDSLVVAGAAYVALGPAMLIQILYSMLYSNFVSSSPRKKSIELAVMDFICIASGIQTYLVVLIITIVKVVFMHKEAEWNLKIMLLSSLFIALVFIFFGAAYKYFWISFVIFMLGVCLGYGGGMIAISTMDFTLDIVSVSLICLLIQGGGILLSCFLRRLLYKKGVSSRAIGASLRKAMQ